MRTRMIAVAALAAVTAAALSACGSPSKAGAPTAPTRASSPSPSPVDQGALLSARLSKLAQCANMTEDQPNADMPPLKSSSHEFVCPTVDNKGARTWGIVAYTFPDKYAWNDGGNDVAQSGWKASTFESSAPDEHWYVIVSPYLRSAKQQIQDAVGGVPFNG